MRKLYALFIASLLAFAANAEGYYINGTFNGWLSWTETALAAYKFQPTAQSGIYTLDLSTTPKPDLSADFLIVKVNGSNVDWKTGKFAGSGNKLAEGKPYTYSVGGNNNINVDGTIKNAVITLNTNNKTITVTGKAEANSFDVVYMIGNFNGFDWVADRTDYPLNPVAGKENTYSGTYELTAATTYCKPKCGAQILGPDGEDLTPQIGVTYDIKAGTSNAFALPAGKYTFTVVADQAAETAKITIDSDTEIPADYSKFYVNVVGDFNDWMDNGVQPDNNGMAEMKLDNVNTAFKVKVWNGGADVYYAKSGTLAVGEWVDITGNQDGMMLPADLQNVNVTIDFDCATGRIKVEKTGGVNDILADEQGTLTYYNMQGVAVSAPTPGLYIVVRGGKAKRLLVR